MNQRAFSILQIAFWAAVVLFAFAMQVIPFLLILTMINIAFGVSSTAMLLIIPTALFGMIISTCLIVERHRKRNWMKYVPAQTNDRSSFMSAKEVRAATVQSMRRRY